MLKREKILELFKLLVFFKISFNLKKKFNFINVKKNRLFKRKLRKWKWRKRLIPKLIDRDLRNYLLKNIFYIVLLPHAKYIIKKFIWTRKKFYSYIKKFKGIISKSVKKVTCNVHFFFFYRFINNSFKVKKFDFFIRKKFKDKYKISKNYITFMIKRDNFFFLYYLYLNKKILFIKSTKDYKKIDRFRLGRIQYIMGRLFCLYLIAFLKLHNIKKINLAISMKKSRRLNKKKYRIRTKTFIKFTIFKNLFKIYKRLKRFDESLVIKFKFIYNQSHSKRTEKLKKKRRK